MNLDLLFIAAGICAMVNILSSFLPPHKDSEGVANDAFRTAQYVVGLSIIATMSIYLLLTYLNQ